MYNNAQAWRTEGNAWELGFYDSQFYVFDTKITETDSVVTEVTLVTVRNFGENSYAESAWTAAVSDSETTVLRIVAKRLSKNTFACISKIF